MINKILYILFLSFLSFTFGMKAETVSQKQASQIASEFFNAASGQVLAKPNLVYNGRRLTTDRLFTPFYVYNHPAGGFVIISAENKAFPILGYNLVENFNPDHMDKTMEALLRRYATDIEAIRYDSRVPEEAIKAWGDLRGYIASILAAPYDATDPQIEIEEAAETVDNYETTDRLDELSSDLYTPSQWLEQVDAELEKEGNFPLGVIDRGNLVAGVVHGKKGDYYRLFAGEYDSRLMRLFATEFLSYGLVADFGNLPDLDEDPEDVPFMFYESFITETRDNLEGIQRMREEKLNPSEPRLKNIGGGRYVVSLPEKALMSRTYNLSGSLVQQKTYDGNYEASINLEGLPYGFYIVVVNTESGQPYEFKLSR